MRPIVRRDPNRVISWCKSKIWMAAGVIPSEAAKRRSRVIAIVPKEGPLSRDDRDSSLRSE
jgi:hypothetical protein